MKNRKLSIWLPLIWNKCVFYMPTVSFWIKLTFFFFDLLNILSLNHICCLSENKTNEFTHSILTSSEPWGTWFEQRHWNIFIILSSFHWHLSILLYICSIHLNFQLCVLLSIKMVFRIFNNFVTFVKRKRKKKTHRSRPPSSNHWKCLF